MLVIMHVAPLSSPDHSAFESTPSDSSLQGGAVAQSVERVTLDHRVGCPLPTCWVGVSIMLWSPRSVSIWHHVKLSDVRRQTWDLSAI